MKLQVAVIFGGMSCEHEISVISANQAINALDTDKYDLVPIYISKQQRLYTGEALLSLENYSDLSSLLTRVDEINLVRLSDGVYCENVKKSLFNNKKRKIDVAIPVMHGTNGEDGTVQGYLEMLQLPYAGCDIASAAIGQDKVLQKAVLEFNKISVVPSFWIYANDVEAEKVKLLKKADKLGYPVIIKPANLGSSIGIEIAHSADDLLEKLMEASQYDSKLLVEKVITNMTEINCSILGSADNCQASVLERVLKGDEILSFSDKYQGGAKGASKSKMPSKMGGEGSKGMASTNRIVPADIDAKLTSKIQKMALDTFKALNASGVCRIDFIYDEDTKKVYVNEINTIPGSLAFYLWMESGINFDQLMDKLVDSAIDKERKKSKRIVSFDTNILQSFAKK